MKPRKILSAGLACVIAVFSSVSAAAAAETPAAPDTNTVAINETNFPDAAFRSYVTNNFDKDKNAELSLAERNAVMSVNVADLSVSDLTGIGQFGKITSLNCSGNQLTVLDLKGNTSLKSINCSKNKIASLDVSANKKLEKLNCSDNQLTALNVSANTALTQLKCEGNSIAALDITGLSAIIKAYDSATPLPDVFSYDKATEVSFTKETSPVGKADPETITINGDEPTSPNIVWINGKKVKDDPSTKDVDETKNYKTFTYNNVGMYSGGKWTVAVMPEDIDTVEKFTALFSPNKSTFTTAGKTANKNAKKIANAKIKNGVITVTAGKEAGKVQVWLYEVNKKTVVSDDSLKIQPKRVTVEALAAPSSLVLAEKADFTDGKLADGKKTVSKITVPYKVDAPAQESYIIGYGGKKEAISKCADFTLTNTDPNTASVISDGAGGLVILPAADGETILTLESLQSGKKAKITVICEKYYQVTFPEGVSVTYRNGSETVNMKSGDFAPNRATLNISVSSELGAQITAGEKNIKANGTSPTKSKYIISSAKVDITVEDTPSPTPAA